MLRYALALVSLTVCLAGAVFAADSAIIRMEIRSTWGGLGIPRKSEILIQKDGGVYHLGTFTVDAFTVIKKNHASTSNDDL